MYTIVYVVKTTTDNKSSSKLRAMTSNKNNESEAIEDFKLLIEKHFNSVMVEEFSNKQGSETKILKILEGNADKWASNEEKCIYNF